MTGDEPLPPRADPVGRAMSAIGVLLTRGAPGQRLPSERDLARDLGIGRAHVRKALVRLGARELVVTRPQHGSFIPGGDGVVPPSG